MQDQLAITPMEVSSKYFGFCEADGVLSVEASTLNAVGGTITKLIKVRSERTSNIVEFVFREQVYDRALGELRGWVFIPKTKVKTLKKMIVYND